MAQATQLRTPMVDSSAVTGPGGPIGHIDKVTGEVMIVHPDGTRVPAAAGDPVYQGDALETGAHGALGVVFADETTLAMAENCQMVLDEMVYDPGDQSGHMSMSVGQGVFTFVSGQLAKVDPEAMVVHTPVATLGIRGTQAGIHIPDGKALTVVLMEEADGMVGEVVIYNDFGTMTLNMAGAAASVGGYGFAPFALDTFMPDGIVGMFGNTLMHLPLQFAPENNYGMTPDSAFEPSVGNVAQFETAAGGQPESPLEPIRVVGEDYTVRPEGAGGLEQPDQLRPVTAATPTAATPAQPNEAATVVAAGTTAEAANVAPQAIDMTAETAEDGTLVGQLIATDADSTTLTYALAEGGGPAHGSLVLNPDGTYVYTPDPNYAGTDTFTYQVSDGEGGTTTATVSVAVGAVEDIPTAEAVAGTIGEDTVALTLDLSDKVADVETATENLTLSVDTGDTGWIAAIDGTTVTLNAPAGVYDALAAGETATETFTYTVTDEAGESTTSTISVTVTGTNDLPVASDVQVSGLEDAAVSGQLLATDIDSATLTYALAADGGPANGEVVINPDGTYTYTPAENFYGTDSFTYTVDDGAGGTATATVSVAVGAVEDIPTAEAVAGTIGEDTVALTLDLSDKIADVETATENLTLSVDTGDTGWIAAIDGATVTLNAPAGVYDALAAGETATETFTYTVTDEAGESTTSTISVTVTGTNDLPVASDVQVSGLEDAAVSGQLLATDIDSATLTYALAADGGPANGEVVINPDGTYTYTPAENFYGTDSFTYTVDDGAGGTATATVTVAVGAVEDIPTAEAVAGVVDEDALTLTIDLADKIADVESADEELMLSVNTAGTPWTATLDGTTLTLTALAGAYDALAAGETAAETFTYTVTDEAGESTTSTIGLTITGTNDLPVASNLVVSGLEDQTVSGQLLATDVDSDTLVYALAADGGPANGEVVVNPDGTYVYTPAENFYGTDSFTYQVDDGAGGVAHATVTLNIADVEEPGPEAIVGTEGADVLYGTGHDDVIYGLGGDDALFGKGGDDLLDGGAGDDVLHGQGGDDVLYGGAGHDELYGEGGHDVLYGGEGNDLLDGGGGHDVMYGEGGTDVMYGGGGNDEMDGGAGADEMHGGGGHDVMHGGEGSDIMYGDGGNDVMYGGEGADRMDGGAGDDVLVGGVGADRLTGGAGHDTFVFDANAARDIISDFQHQDTLRFEGPEFSAEDVQFKQTGDDITISFKGEGGTSVVLENMDLDQSSYTVTQDADAVVITMDDKNCGG